MSDQRGPARQMDQPQTGYWRTRLVRNGPWVAMSIQWEQTTHEPGVEHNLMERSPILTARINGELASLDEVWLRRAEPINKATHDWMVADARWASEYAPSDVQAQPRKSVDLMRTRIPF